MYVMNIFVLRICMWLGGLWYHCKGVYAFGMIVVGCEIFYWLCLQVWLRYFHVSFVDSLRSCKLLVGISYCG